MPGIMKPPCDEAVIRSGDVADPCAASSGVWVLIATILGSSMAFIDSTVVNIALPALQADFHASIVAVQWVVESYGLLLAALVLAGGSLGDRLGRRFVFLAGVTLFALASLGCALVSDIDQLIIARSLQGAGGALRCVRGAACALWPAIPRGGKAFNRPAFTPPPTGRQGDFGRNVLRGFGAGQADVALQRQFQLIDNMGLHFRGEFFNLFNHPIFGAPTNSLTSPLFGQSTQTLASSLAGADDAGFNPLYQIGGPRSIQLALKLQF